MVTASRMIGTFHAAFLENDSATPLPVNVLFRIVLRLSPWRHRPELPVKDESTTVTKRAEFTTHPALSAKSLLVM